MPVEVRTEERNLGFARGVNRLAETVTTPCMLVLNPDCLIAPADLAELCDELERHPAAGMVSGCVVDTEGREQRGSRRAAPTPSRLVAEFRGAARRGGHGVDLTDTPRPEAGVEIEAVSGACMLVRTRVFRELGGLDEGFPMHFEDLDLMTRMRSAGWRIRYRPDVVIRHAGGVSSRSRPARVEWNKHAGLWRYMRRHWRGEIPWPAWPAWWLLIRAHALVAVARAWLAR